MVNFALLENPSQINLFGNLLATTSVNAAHIFSHRGKVLASTTCRGFQNGSALVSVRDKPFNWDDNEPKPVEFIDLEDVLLIGSDGHSIKEWRPSSRQKIKSVHVETLLTAKQNKETEIIFSSSDGLFELNTNEIMKHRVKSPIKLVGEFKNVVYMVTEDEIVTVTNGEWKIQPLKCTPLMVLNGILVYFQRKESPGIQYPIKALDIIQGKSLRILINYQNNFMKCMTNELWSNTLSIEPIETSEVVGTDTIVPWMEKNLRIYIRESDDTRTVRHYQVNLKQKNDKLEMMFTETPANAVNTGVDEGIYFDLLP